MDGKALCQNLRKTMTIITSDDHNGGWVDVLQYLKFFSIHYSKRLLVFSIFFFFFPLRNEPCPQGLQAVRVDRFIIQSLKDIIFGQRTPVIIFTVQKGELKIRKSNDLPKVTQLGGRRVMALAQLSDPTLHPEDGCLHLSSGTQ